jgi:hypothetical protein
MTPRIITAYLLGTALFSFTLLAQPKSAKGSDDEKPGFAVRQSTPENGKIRTEEAPSVRQAPEANPAMAYQAGTSPFAPTVCRHDDLSKDMEFRQCTNYLLDSSGSVRVKMNTFASDSGE